MYLLALAEVSPRAVRIGRAKKNRGAREKPRSGAPKIDGNAGDFRGPRGGGNVAGCNDRDRQMTMLDIPARLFNCCELRGPSFSLFIT